MPTNIERDITQLSHGNGPDAWIFFDDFNDLNWSATAGLAKWTRVEDTDGTELLSLTAGGGVLEYTHTAADNDVISLQANAGIKVSDLKAGASLYFGVRFKVTDADDVDLHVGLGIVDTDYTSFPADAVMFQMVDASATLNLVCAKDSVSVTATNIAAIADDTWVRAFFKYTPGATTDIGDLDYVVHSNGLRTKGTIATNGCFPDDVVIFPILQDNTGSASADVTSFDWIYCYATRADYVDGTG